jgi:hypothetical protein
MKLEIELKVPEKGDTLPFIVAVNNEATLEYDNEGLLCCDDYRVEQGMANFLGLKEAIQTATTVQ